MMSRCGRKKKIGNYGLEWSGCSCFRTTKLKGWGISVLKECPTLCQYPGNILLNIDI